MEKMSGNFEITQLSRDKNTLTGVIYLSFFSFRDRLIEMSKVNFHRVDPLNHCGIESYQPYPRAHHFYWSLCKKKLVVHPLECLLELSNNGETRDYNIEAKLEQDIEQLQLLLT